MAPCPVNAWNEWDPLEEVIVGVAYGAHVPTARDPLLHDGAGNRAMGGTPYPLELIGRIQSQLDNFVLVLESEGVTVRRPTLFDLSAPTTTPCFHVPCGYNLMNPRDLVLVVGDQIIETPSASRSRYFEAFAYRELFKEYFLAGAGAGGLMGRPGRAAVEPLALMVVLCPCWPG